MNNLLEQIEIEQSIAAEFRESLPEHFSFAETDQITTESAIAVLRYLLRVGDDGYKGEISAFDPPPDLDNNWLWTDDGIEGIFIDTNPGTVHSAIAFRLYKDKSSPTGVTRVFQPVQNRQIN